MKTYAVYKGIKAQLKDLCEVMYFTGQYTKGKENTSYVCPAIYIEMPKSLKVDYFPVGIKVAKGAEIKIHFLSPAPFQGHDNQTQEDAIASHESTLGEIMEILEGLEVKDNSLRVIASTLIHTGSSTITYRPMHTVSVMSYKTELRDYTTKRYTGSLPDGELEVVVQ